MNGLHLKNLWLARLRQSRTHLKSVWFIAAGIAAIYYGAIQPSEAFRGVSAQRGSAMRAIEDRRHEHWYSPNYQAAGLAEGTVGGIPGDSPISNSNVVEPERADDRKVIRSASIALVLDKPADAARTIQRLAEGAGGFLTSSEAYGGQAAPRASVTVCVPVAKFEAIMAEIRKLAQGVESEQVQAKDVTRQYIDNDAYLRNLRAEEMQYLAILRQARTVKDTLEVSDKLNQVRGQIGQQQSEFNTLSKQVELVAIAVSLRREAEAQLFGLPWRPANEFKFAARQGLEGLLDYSTSILSFVFYLPAIILWMATILAALAATWRILRWAGRLLFPGNNAAVLSS
jgi:uncharacterized protein DUF4349